MYDSVLITPPISSPLHPQAALPLLKGFLQAKGFKTLVLDTNIKFFHWFLGEKIYDLSTEQLLNYPLSILKTYNDIENALWEKSQPYDGLAVGMRYLETKYDRTRFSEVIKAVNDQETNPFRAFYEEIIDEYFIENSPKIVGISITFQDQIIPAFTFADIVRKRLPQAKIVLGGQIVTRCYESMVQDSNIGNYYDYLALWDGEIPLLDIHRKEIGGEDVDFVNVIDATSTSYNVDRRKAAPAAIDLPFTDFTDIDFDEYFLPEMLVPMQTTRGCYGSCEFCAIPFGSNSYRIRKKDHVVEEIKLIQQHTLDKYGRKATYFKFMEDTSSPKLLLEIAKEIEKQQLDVKWETFARLEKAFTKEGVMEQLYRGGCRKIHWGLESNDPDVLKDMNKKIKASYSTQVMDLAAKAGIFNFCFILVGFPTETDAARQRVIDYVIAQKSIHTITPTTFDLTRGAPMQLNFADDNSFGMTRREAKDFEVRLPYLVHGEHWKEKIVPKAHALMAAVVKDRPDLGFASVFPDQIRSLFTDHFGCDWAGVLGERYGQEIVRELLLNIQQYAEAYAEKREIDPSMLPEAMRREHFRTKEDIKLISNAVMSRKGYERKRFDQV